MTLQSLFATALLIAGLSFFAPGPAQAACQCTCQIEGAGGVTREADLGEAADRAGCTELCESQIGDEETVTEVRCVGAAVCECCSGSPPPEPIINTIGECKTACGTAGSGFGGAQLGGFKSFGETTAACAGEEKAAGPTIPRLVNPLGVGITVPQIIGRIIKAILGISGSLALAFFVWGGFLWLTSGGSADKIEQGKRTLVWATLGLALIFGAYAITDFVIKAISGAAGT